MNDELDRCGGNAKKSRLARAEWSFNQTWQTRKTRYNNGNHETQGHVRCSSSSSWPAEDEIEKNFRCRCFKLVSALLRLEILLRPIQYLYFKMRFRKLLQQLHKRWTRIAFSPRVKSGKQWLFFVLNCFV